MKNLFRLFFLTFLFAQISFAAPLSWLKVQDAKIVDETGREIVLSGVNLGAWLVEEPWMMPYETKAPDAEFTDVKDAVSLTAVLEKRFGKTEALRVRAALRNAWISSADFDRIKAANLNCVRVPFTYDLLDEPDGFAWLDKVIDEAAQRGLYVILDLHGAPGRQNNSDHSGQENVDLLFKNYDFVKQTAALWAKIAARYRDHPEVAGYDLMNEPTGAPDAASLFIVSDQLYRAIRAVDTRHIVFIEDGYKGIETFPRPNIVGWENVVLSWHHYNFGAKNEDDQLKGILKVANEAQGIQKSRKAPVFIGELQLEPHGTPQTLAKGLTAFQQAGISWTTWSYKSAMKNGGGGMWGWFHAPKALNALNPFTDSADELIIKAAQWKTENLEENKGITATFQQVANVRPLPPLQEIVPTAQNAALFWKYTLQKPADNWFKPDFNETNWQEGAAGFGGEWNFAGKVRTAWKTDNIWLRRAFDLPDLDISTLRLLVCHDDDAEIYINGVLAAKLTGYQHNYNEETISPEALAALKTGQNFMAVHCYQGTGDQYIDVGLVGLKK